MKRMVKRIVAVALITNLSVLNTAIVGKNVVSAVSDALESQEINVNKTNILFDAYLKNGDTNVHEMDVNIDEVNNLYVSIGIGTEGVLNGGKIKLTDSNIKFDPNMQESMYIKSISENEIELNQIRYEENIVLEIPVLFIVKDNVDTDYMNKTSKLVLEGNYKEDENEEVISSEILVKMNYSADVEVNVESSFEKNTTLDNGNILVEQVITSKVVDNTLPKEEEQLYVSVPEIEGIKPENISVMVNDVKLEDGEGFSYNEETAILEIANDKVVSNKVSWIDEEYKYKIVYVYSSEVELKEREIDNLVNVETKILTKSDSLTSEISENQLVEIFGNVVDIEIEEVSVGKGYMYSKTEDTRYEEIMKINISNVQNASETIIKMSNTKLVLDDGNTGNISGKVSYERLAVDKTNLLDLLGTEGYLKILNSDGVVISTITNESSTNGDGEVVINIPDSANGITIVASNILKEGTIEIASTRVIDKDIEISKANLLNAVSITEEKSVNGNTEISVVNLVETKTEASLQVNNATLTTAEENKDAQIVVNFNTSSNEYDLFKNPTVRIQMPEEIKSISVNNSEIAYTDELKVSKIYADGRELVVEITGEQTKYTEETVIGPALVLDFNVVLNENAARQEKTIVATYTNENATQYVSGETGKTTAKINLTTPKDLTLINNIDGLGVKTQGLEEVEKVKLEGEKSSIKTKNEIEVVNNYSYAVEVVKVLGALGNDNDQNNLGIKILSEVNVSGIENYTVYYTANENATSELGKTENGWSTEMTKATKYMVVAQDFESTSKIQISYDMEIPEELSDGLSAELGYEVIYGNSNVANTMESTEIMLMTSEAANIVTTLTATVGGEAISETVKQNEVITYTAVLKNEGSEDKTNINVTGLVPEGSKIIEFDYEWMEFGYSDASEFVSTISLAAGQQVTITYDVQVDSDAEVNTKIMNKVTTECSGVTSVSNEVELMVNQANLSVLFSRRTNMETENVTNDLCQYFIEITNTSDSELSNVLLTNELSKLGTIVDITFLGEDTYTSYDMTDAVGTVTIDKLESGESVLIRYSVEFDFSDTETDIITMVANAKAAGETYVSNVWSEVGNHYSASIKAVSSEQKEYETGDTVVYKYVIENHSGREIENAKFTTELSDELMFKGILIDGESGSSTTRYISEEITVNDSVEIVVTAAVVEKIWRAEDVTVENIARLYLNNGVLATSEVIEYIIKADQDNSLQERVEAANVELTTTSGETVEQGERITYTYNVSNSGNVDILAAKMKTTIPSQLIVNKVYINGSEYYTEYNDIEMTFSLAKDVEVIIEATVKEETNVGTTITNEAVVTYDEKEIGVSNKLIQVVVAGDSDGGANDDGGNNEQGDGSEGNGNEDTEVDTQLVSGVAWLDSNENGSKDSGETTLSGIKIKAVDVITNKYATYNGKEVEATTSSTGEYSLSLPEGKYILVFEYDNEKYKLSKYKSEGASLDSDVFENDVNINGVIELKPITDIITISGSNISGIDIGLIENQIFDMKLEKYISKVILVNDEGTTTNEYDRQTLVKLEVDKNKIDQTEAVIEYEIVVSNVGEVSGYIKNIIDYLPADLEFNSEMNTSWYMENGNVYSNELYNQKINPGEEKVIKLVVTKSLNGTQTGLTSNRAEIYETENEQGLSDNNSTPGNNKDGENDLGIAEIIFTIDTGAAVRNAVVIIVSAVTLGTVVVVLRRKKK